MSRRWKLFRRLLVVPFFTAALWPAVSVAANCNDRDNFGAQCRADAAKRMIVLAVQQAVSSLPPTSAQAFTYEFDPQLDAVVRSDRLGPVVLRSPNPLGAGRFSFRVASSYFGASDSLRPIRYIDEVGQQETRFGLDASAQVILTNVAVAYGLSKHVELDANLPIVTTRVHAKDVFISSADPNLQGYVVALPSPDPIPACLKGRQCVEQHRRFSEVGADFPDGTHVGIGRATLGLKALLYSGRKLQVGFAPELALPSPSEDQLAGSGTAAFLSRGVAVFALSNTVRLHCDVGYDADFAKDELRRFVWDTGVSISMAQASVDVGVGGSDFNRGVKWTPDEVLSAPGPNGVKFTASGNNRLGETFVDFLAGLRFRLTDSIIISGAVTVPVNDEGFRPAATGTIALDVYL